MTFVRVITPIAGLCTATVIACASGSGTTLAPQDLDLSGSWALNAELSDNPQELLREGGMPGGPMGGRPGGMGGERPTGGIGGARPPGGMGGRGGPRGGAPNQDDQQGMQQTMRMATQPPRRIDIQQQDTTVTLRDGRGLTLLVHTNWKKATQEIDNGGHVDIRAQWQDRGLLVEREFDHGGKVVQKYYLSPDTGRLHVETRLEMGRGGQARTFHYVYDAVQTQT